MSRRGRWTPFILLLCGPACGTSGTDPSSPVPPPATTNAPPMLTGMTVQGASPREPAQYATLDETVTVSAIVTDLETPISQLSFVWSASAGTFSGSGQTVSWTAPHQAATPATMSLNLTITERYQKIDGSGLPIAAENIVNGSTTLRLHDSVGEVSDLAVQFLTDFSKQLDPAFVVRNFSDHCSGKADEFNDVTNDNRDFTMNSYAVGQATTAVSWTGLCSFRDKPGDACTQVPVEWHTTNKKTGGAGVAVGIDHVAAIFESDQWRLCSSDFETAGASTSGLRFAR